MVVVRNLDSSRCFASLRSQSQGSLSKITHKDIVERQAAKFDKILSDGWHGGKAEVKTINNARGKKGGNEKYGKNNGFEDDGVRSSGDGQCLWGDE